jgi:hypothetical protein
MTFLEAALEILKRERRPLHFKEMTEKAMDRKLLTFVGRTPEVTMQTQLTNAVKKAPGNPFVRVKPGVFGLLRYPEGETEPEPQTEAPVEVQEDTAAKGEGEAAAGEGRGRRRRRGGRGRRRGGSDRTAATTERAEGEEAQEQVAPAPAAAEEPEAQDGPEEPEIGTMSAEARAAALAETGVLEGAEESEEDEEHEEPSAEAESESEATARAEAAEPETHVGRETAPSEAEETGAPAPEAKPEAVESRPAAHAASETNAEAPQQVRKIMTPGDAAVEILRGQAPGRGLHVRQIADAAVRRRLIHGEPNEAWRVMRTALAAEGKERLRSGQRPRVKPAGSGLYALARRPPDTDLEKAEHVFGEARRALRERTIAAIEQRMGELTPAAFEAIARVLLQREGFGPATFVKRVETTVYLEALRGRGFRPSKCLIALRAGSTSAGRRAIGELRAGIRARNQDEGLIVLAGRMADDAISEWKQPGPPVEVVDGPALAETCVRHGVGVVSANVSVEFVDADFFAEISEG